MILDVYPISLSLLWNIERIGEDLYDLILTNAIDMHVIEFVIDTNMYYMEYEW